MNLDSAFDAHAQWRKTFGAAISGRYPMDDRFIALDNCCELGKWLHGDGKKAYGSKPQFVALIESHMAFHVEAGKVAELINAEQYDQATQALDKGTAFADASAEISAAIAALKQVVR